MKKIRRMLSTLVIASMLMNVPARVFAESAGEAPAAVGQQAEAPMQDANDRCLCRKRERVGVWQKLYRRMSVNVPWYSAVF